MPKQQDGSRELSAGSDLELLSMEELKRESRKSESNIKVARDHIAWLIKDFENSTGRLKHAETVIAALEAIRTSSCREADLESQGAAALIDDSRSSMHDITT
jgi:hypothetical protein